MDEQWLLYIAAFSCAFGVALVSTPLAKKLAIKTGAIDYPRERGMHKEPIPRMGGIAIILGFMATMLILLPFVPELRTKQFVGFLIGGIIIAFTGIIDDIYHLKPKSKFAFQVVAALVVVFSGTRIEFVIWPINASLTPISAPITLLWIIGVINAVNLIDGLDGLAAGVSTIASLCLVVLCVLSGSELAVVLSAALAGSCLGFLPRNFNPAEVIMGDCGALFLGYVLSVSSIIGVFKGYALLAVVIAVLALALPIIDTLFAIIRRTINGKPFYEADRGHLHHRLIDAGYSTKNSVIILYFLSAASGIIAILIALQDYRALIIACVFLVVMISMLFVYRKRTTHKNDSTNDKDVSKK